MDGFRCDKTALKIGVNRSRGGWRFLAGVNGPRARLLFPSGKKRPQPEQMIDRANERVHTGVFHAEAAQVFERLLLSEVDKLTLDLRADHNCFSGEMVARVILNKIDVSRGGVRGVAFGNCCQIRLRQLAGKTCWL